MNGKQHKTDNGKGVTAEVLLPNNFCALASEKSLSKDWTRPEEDEAWNDL